MALKIPLFGKIMIINSVIFIVMLFTLIMAGVIFRLYEYQENIRYINEILIHISKHRLELLNQKDETYKERFLENIENINKLKQIYKKSFLKISDKKEYSKLNLQILTYFDSIDVYAKKIEEIGLDENSGIEMSFREKVHNVEKYLKKLNQDELQIIQLQLRRREKDFIIRGKTEYKDKVTKIVKEFLQKIENSNLINLDKSELKNLIQGYSDTFLIYAAQREKIASLHHSLSNEEEDVYKSLNKIIKEESINITNSKTILFAIICLAIFIAFIFSYFATKRIVYPFKQSVLILNQIANGNINDAIVQIEQLEKAYYKS
jgi:hypothetical protein